MKLHPRCPPANTFADRAVATAGLTVAIQRVTAILFGELPDALQDRQAGSLPHASDASVVREWSRDLTLIFPPISLASDGIFSY